MRHHRSRRLSSAIGTPCCRTSDLPVLDTHHTSKDGLPGPDRTVPLPISRSYDAGFRLPSWGSANPTCPSATDFRLRLLDFRFTNLFIPVTLQHWRHLRRRLFHILAYFDDTSTQGVAVQSPSDYARWFYFCSNLLLDFCFNLLLLDSRCFVSSPAPRPPTVYLASRKGAAWTSAGLSEAQIPPRCRCSRHALSRAQCSYTLEQVCMVTNTPLDDPPTHSRRRRISDTPFCGRPCGHSLLPTQTTLLNRPSTLTVPLPLLARRRGGTRSTSPALRRYLLVVVPCRPHQQGRILP